MLFRSKINRNNVLETALYNRELLKLANTVTPLAPELAEIELCLAVQEALTNNKTVRELRRATLEANRQLLQLQRRLDGESARSTPPVSSRARPSQSPRE